MRRVKYSFTGVSDNAPLCITYKYRNSVHKLVLTEGSTSFIEHPFEKEGTCISTVTREVRGARWGGGREREGTSQMRWASYDRAFSALPSPLSRDNGQRGEECARKAEEVVEVCNGGTKT